MSSVLPLLARHYGEPYADSSAIPTYYLSKLTRDFVTVALAGDGGDELFAGYQRYHAVRLAAALDRVPAAVRVPILGGAEAILPRSGDQRGGSTRLRRFLSGARRRDGERYLFWLAIADDQWLAANATADFRPYAEGAARELARRAALPVGDAV